LDAAGEQLEFFVDYARGGGSSGALLSDSGFSATNARTLGGFVLTVVRYARALAIAVTGQGAID